MSGTDLQRAQVLFTWGDEWITYDGGRSQQTDCQVEQLWVNSIQWSTVGKVCGPTGCPLSGALLGLRPTLGLRAAVGLYALRARGQALRLWPAVAWRNGDLSRRRGCPEASAGAGGPNFAGSGGIRQGEAVDVAK